MRKETGGVLDPLDEEGSFDDGDPYTTNLYIGKSAVLQVMIIRAACSVASILFHAAA